jgi:thioredoxin-like negative regulator of GroEL
MVTETWSHPQIRAGVAHFCEAITINATHAPELAKQLGVRAYPTTLVISPDAQLLCRIEGFANPQKFAEQMWPVLRAAEADRLAARPAAAAPAAMAPASHQPLYRPAAAGGR